MADHEKSGGGPGGGVVYRSRFIRRKKALSAALALIAVLAAGFLAILVFVDESRVEATSLGFTAVWLSLLALAFANAVRLHIWSIEADGLRIDERPAAPFTGRRRSAFIRFSEVASLEFAREEPGASLVLEARDGRRFRIVQALRARPGSYVLTPDKAADLDDFASAVRERAARAGLARPPLTVKPGYFETEAGFRALAIVFLLSLPMAGGTLWLVLGGATPALMVGTPFEFAAILALAPIASGLALVRAHRRRRLRPARE